MLKLIHHYLSILLFIIIVITSLVFICKFYSIYTIYYEKAIEQQDLANQVKSTEFCINLGIAERLSKHGYVDCDKIRMDIKEGPIIVAIDNSLNDIIKFLYVPICILKWAAMSLIFIILIIFAFFLTLGCFLYVKNKAINFFSNKKKYNNNYDNYIKLE